SSRTLAYETRTSRGRTRIRLDRALRSDRSDRGSGDRNSRGLNGKENRTRRVAPRPRVDQGTGRSSLLGPSRVRDLGRAGTSRVVSHWGKFAACEESLRRAVVAKDATTFSADLLLDSQKFYVPNPFSLCD